MSITAQVFDPGSAVVAQGVIEWVNTKATEVQNTTRIVMGAISVIGICVVAVKSRFALAAILVAIAVAGLLNWGVWNVTDVSDKIGDEINAAPNEAIILIAPSIPSTVVA
ncbi:hypothetical protein SIM91_00200 [Rhodococcus opacus]|uniref:hypothetical protein n=1 Tax=Rhodococcus opacus TaxID=37919 RepID=UPI0029C362BE|nr:hypothetical protein [Rhodococcus opacus]MDX5961792.1 hypothetical protein [Rhodococcus opacus]